MSDAKAEESVELTAQEKEGDVEAADPNGKSEVKHQPEASTGSAWGDKYHQWRSMKYKLPRYYRLSTEENASKYSLWSVNFMILASAVNTKMLNPNFAIMCAPGAHPDSFTSTEPFGFNSATYFLPMCTLIGVAIASVFIGTLSDKYGRKPLLLVLGWISAAGSIVKYYTSDTFWGFCAANFAFGFFLGNLPVGMGYIGDVENNQKRKNDLLGNLVGCFVLGNSGGGIIAVLMNEQGLFAPLWVGAGLMVIANVITHAYMIEPGDARLEQEVTDKFTVDEDDVVVRPDTIDKKTMYNIVGGAVLDNIGSTGLFPLCLSPLALDTFYGQFVNAGEEPIMSILAYQWLSVCVALLVIPSTQLTPYSFVKMGVAGTCVFGNMCTAIVTSLLLWIGNMPASDLTFGFFVFVMYAGFPFTVFSQLTTGPMLDVIAPEDKIGYVQGLNNAAMNFGMALAPWAFGLLADAAGTNVAIIVGIAFSVGAALANSPLTWHPLMGRPKPKPPLAKRALPEEDDELFQKILDGEVVDPELVFELNHHRGMVGKPSIVPAVKPYEEEKDDLDKLRAGAAENFRFRMNLQDRVLAGLANGEKDADNLVFSKKELVEIFNTMMITDKDVTEKATNDLGIWMGQYLKDNGYNPHTSSVMAKQMFMAAFPPLCRDDKATEENVTAWLLRSRKVMSRYAEEAEKNTATHAMATAGWGIHGAGGWW